jgi:hypothetical protein
MHRSLLAALALLAVACQDPAPAPLQEVGYGEILLRLDGHDLHGRFDFDSVIGSYDHTAHRVIVRGSTAPGPAAPDYIGIWLESFTGKGSYTLGPANGLNSLTFFIELSPGTDTGQRIVFETDQEHQAIVRIVEWNPVTCELRGDFAGHVRQGSAGVYPVEGAFWGRLMDFTVPGGVCSGL